MDLSFDLMVIAHYDRGSVDSLTTDFLVVHRTRHGGRSIKRISRGMHFRLKRWLKLGASMLNFIRCTMNMPLWGDLAISSSGTKIYAQLFAQNHHDVNLYII